MDNVSTLNPRESPCNDGSDYQQPHLDHELEIVPQSKKSLEGNDMMVEWKEV